MTRYLRSQGQLVWMACMNGSSKNNVTSSSLPTTSAQTTSRFTTACTTYPSAFAMIMMAMVVYRNSNCILWYQVFSSSSWLSLATVFTSFVTVFFVIIMIVSYNIFNMQNRFDFEASPWPNWHACRAQNTFCSHPPPDLSSANVPYALRCTGGGWD